MKNYKNEVAIYRACSKEHPDNEVLLVVGIDCNDENLNFLRSMVFDSKTYTPLGEAHCEAIYPDNDEDSLFMFARSLVQNEYRWYFMIGGIRFEKNVELADVADQVGWQDALYMFISMMTNGESVLTQKHISVYEPILNKRFVVPVSEVVQYLVHTRNVRNTATRTLYNAALQMFGNPADGDMLYDFFMFCQSNYAIVFSVNDKKGFGNVKITNPQTLQVYTDWLSKQLDRRWQSASKYLKEYVSKGGK